jgi:regulator of sigma E protease
MVLTLFIFIFILSILVLIHEAGHFFMAKKFGIKVEEFGYGIPPRAWGKKIGETIYSINWLPFGGFVKLYGEDEAGSGSVQVPAKKLPTKDLDRAFFTRPVWQRALVVVAGVVMNTLLAAVIYYVFFFISNFQTELPLLNNHTFFGVNQKNVTEVLITAVAKNSPAEKAGVTEYSRVMALNGKPVVSPESFSKIIKESKGKPVTLTWQDTKTAKNTTATLTPRINPPKGEGALGVGFYPLQKAVLHYETPLQKVFSGFIHPANLMSYNLDVMGSLIKVSIKEKTAAPLSEGVSGPVGIFSLVGTIIDIPDVKERVLQMLNLAGILSISLAFFNVLPIPALDGGRLFFILIEGIFRKKVSPAFEAAVHSIGMMVLLGLIILVTFKDVLQLFK